MSEIAQCEIGMELAAYCDGDRAARNRVRTMQQQQARSRVRFLRSVMRRFEHVMDFRYPHQRFGFAVIEQAVMEWERRRQVWKSGRYAYQTGALDFFFEMSGLEKGYFEHVLHGVGLRV